MEHNYTNTYHNIPEMNNWPQVNHSTFPNPYFVSNQTQRFPYYHSPSDPRFKQAVTYEEPPVLNEIIDQKTDDELWIETYLSKIGKININLHSNIEIITQKPIKITNKKSLKIHVARSVLHRCLRLLEHLQELESHLRDNVATISTTEWKEKTIEIGQQKEEFSALLSQFDDTTTLELLQKTIKKRKHKRHLNRQRKIQKRQTHQQSVQRRELVHKQIDGWLENMKEEVEKVKRDEYLKKDADCVLSEVTKKKSDARKQLSLLATLVKLREIREKKALVNGENLNEDDGKAFKENIDKLKKMWERALEQYSKEEQGLKTMLESNVASSVSSEVSKEKKIISEWESILFGPKIIPNDAYWGLMCAEKDFRMFIAIRKSWDTFLVPDDNKEGSRIPIGWILPDVNNSSWLTNTKK